MTTTDELLARSKSLFQEAITLLKGDAPSAEDVQKAERLKKDALDLKARASQLKEIEMEADLLDKFGGSASPPAGKNTFVDWQEFVEALKRFQKSSGRVRDSRLQVYDDLDLDLKEVKDMTGQTGVAGGFLVQPDQFSGIMAVAAPMTVVRKNAYVIRTNKRQVPIPVLDQTGAVAGQPAFFGFVQVYWTEEATQPTQSDQKFRQATLTVRELAGYVVVGNSLLGDADPSLADLLAGPLGLPGAIAWEEDRAFLNGSGAGQPLGIINAPATKSVTRTTSSTIKYDDLVNMEAGFLGSNPIWIGTQASKATLMLMNGPSGNPAYLWGSAKDGVPDQLLGHPIFFTDKQPAVGAKGDLILADLKYYIILDRQAVTVDFSDQELFKQNKTSIRAIERVEGAPWLSKPVTLSDGTTTMSPFVAIAA